MCDGKDCACKKKREYHDKLLKSSAMAEKHEKCPSCGSDEYWCGFSADGCNVEGFMLIAESECYNCGATWMDTYVFTGKREIKDKGGEPIDMSDIPTEG